VKGLRWINLGPWPPDLAITSDRRAYRRFLRDEVGEKEIPEFPGKDTASTYCVTHKEKGPLVLISLGPQSDQYELASNLAHEATHAMRWILEYVGEEKPGTETEAYLVGYIVKQAMQALDAR